LRGAIKEFHSLNKNIKLIQKQQSEFTKLQNTNKQLSQAIADMRDELLDRPIDIEIEKAKFAKNLEIGLTVDKLTPEQKKAYDLYDSTLKWLKKNGIKFYFFEAPDFAKIRIWMSFIRCRGKAKISFYKIIKNCSVKFLDNVQNVKNISSNKVGMFGMEEDILMGKFIYIKILLAKELQ